LLPKQTDGTLQQLPKPLTEIFHGYVSMVTDGLRALAIVLAKTLDAPLVLVTSFHQESMICSRDSLILQETLMAGTLQQFHVKPPLKEIGSAPPVTIAGVPM
jgi:hypothetical protein